MLQAKPGAFARLGQGGAEGGCFLHNSTYDFNDDVIPLGAGLPRGAGRGGDAAVVALTPHGPASRISRSATSRRASDSVGGCRARGLAVETHVLPGHARRATARSSRSTSRWLGDRRRAGHAGAVRRQRTASRASAARAARSAILHDDAFVRAVDDAGAARAVRACAQSVRLLARAARQRRQRRPQPQLPRFRDAARRVNAGVRRGARASAAGHVAAVAGERSAARRLDRRARRARAARRPSAAVNASFPTGSSTAACGPSGAIARCARCCAQHAARRTQLGWIDFHTGLGPRGHGEKIYNGRDVAADIAPRA